MLTKLAATILVSLVVGTPLFCHSAAAVSENDFAAEYAAKVLPYYETGVGGEFVGVKGASISYRVFDRGPEAPAIVLLPGRSEPYRKYAELIYDLGSRGYSIYTLDHRGQGANARLTPLHDLGHVDDFNDYVADLEIFMQTVVLPARHGKLFLLAHSMGGAIGILYVARHPRSFDAIVLSSPMFDIITGDKSTSYAFVGSLWKVLTGAGGEPVDGPEKYKFDPTIPVERSPVTSSRLRWDKNMEIIRDDPALAVGGVSYGWLFAALNGIANIEQIGRRIEVPVLLLKAGRDTFVRTGIDDWFCWYRPQLCTVVSEPFLDAKHEILQERDEIRDRALELIVGFFR